MTASVSTFKLLRREKDPNFNVDTLEEYELFLQVGSNDFQLSVCDVSSQKILLLEDYIFPHVATPAEKVDLLKSVFDDHQFLMANFWRKVKVAVKNKKFVFMPGELYDERHKKTYLKINAGIDHDSEDIRTGTLPGTDTKVVFTVENDLLAFIEKTYPNAPHAFYHQSISLANGFSNQLTKENHHIACLYIDRFSLHQYIAKEGRFSYYNTFAVGTFEDYIKFISMVADEYGINASNQPIMLWGYIGNHSRQFEELKKIFPGLQCGNRPGGLKYSHALDQIEEHQYFDLFSLNFLS